MTTTPTSSNLTLCCGCGRDVQHSCGGNYLKFLTCPCVTSMARNPRPPISETELISTFGPRMETAAFSGH
jgi:hypothetical protein